MILNYLLELPQTGSDSYNLKRRLVRKKVDIERSKSPIQTFLYRYRTSDLWYFKRPQTVQMSETSSEETFQSRLQKTLLVFHHYSLSSATAEENAKKKRKQEERRCNYETKTLRMTFKWQKHWFYYRRKERGMPLSIVTFEIICL